MEAVEPAAQEAAPQRTDFLATGPNYLDLSQLSDDFAPLSSRGAKQGKKRQRQVQFSMHRALCACLHHVVALNHLAGRRMGQPWRLSILMSVDVLRESEDNDRRTRHVTVLTAGSVM